MLMAESAAFDNLQQLTSMAENLAAFVQQATVQGTAAHQVEKEIWQRVLAMGRQAMVTWEKQSKCPTEKNLGGWTSRINARIARFSDRLRLRDMSTARVKDNGSSSYRSTHGWSCPMASTRMCFRIGRERFVPSMRLGERPKHSKRSLGFHFRSTAWNG